MIKENPKTKTRFNYELSCPQNWTTERRGLQELPSPPPSYFWSSISMYPEKCSYGLFSSGRLHKLLDNLLHSLIILAVRKAFLISHLNLSCYNLRSLFPVLSTMVTKNRPTCDKQVLIWLNILSKPTKKTPKQQPPPKKQQKSQTWKKKNLKNPMSINSVINFLTYAVRLFSKLWAFSSQDLSLNRPEGKMKLIKSCD